MSCHGPDFIDLAVSGTADSDLARRAQIDGASAAEADALIAGVRRMRAAFAIAPQDPRTFRPLQPGGAVLPGASPIERDLAFGEQLVRTMPTLAGPARIASLADAKRARDEFLAVNFDTLQIGVAMPLWSADKFHGPSEATLNDWVADLSRSPLPAHRGDWLALQDAYIADPSDLNFWRLYFALSDMTTPFAGITPVEPGDAIKTQHFTELKFRSTLVGQHLLRSQALGRSGFMRGLTSFAHLSTDPVFSEFRKKSVTFNPGEQLPEFLPNPIWETADFTRGGLLPSPKVGAVPGNIGGQDLLIDRLRLLGYPQFVLDSIDPTTNNYDAQPEFRLAWFMMGLRFDPGLQRTTQSNSTKVGEYLQGELHQQDMFIHRTFVEGLRQVVRVYQPESRGDSPSPKPDLHFGYFGAYGRDRPARWNSATQASVSAATKQRQIASYKQITANFYRMALFLHEEALDNGTIAPYGTSIDRTGRYQSVFEFFAYAGLANRDDDEFLIRRVAAKSRTPLEF